VRVQDEDTCEAEYWDEYLREFGRAAYIEARYQAQRAVELEPRAYDSDDLDHIHSLSPAPLNAHPLAGARQSAGLLEILGRTQHSSVHPQTTCRQMCRRSTSVVPHRRQEVATSSNASHLERRDQ
jgi:hypothetical protein